MNMIAEFLLLTIFLHKIILEVHHSRADDEPDKEDCAHEEQNETLDLVNGAPSGDEEKSAAEKASATRQKKNDQQESAHG